MRAAALAGRTASGANSAAVEYESIIGLEVHCQLLTASKIFCGCSAAFGEAPNSHTCPVCLGLPGVLPVLNEKALEYALKVALACHCRINLESRFARKNYFYPDLPKGYQISQYELPLAEDGYLELKIGDQRRRIGLVRIHLEEDAGKSIHDGLPGTDRYSYVDFNRTGVPLIEIVSQPDLRAPADATDFLTQLKAVVQYLGVCDGNMEEGSLRCDANVSVRPAGHPELLPKTEVKNLNSFRHVHKALEYEIERQIQLLETGGRLVQETRLWDSAAKATQPMRSKEQAHDYRYFPEPDLPPMVISAERLEQIRAALPELAEQRAARLARQYGLPEYDAGVLTLSRSLADYYEAVVAAGAEPKLASNWVMGELLRVVKAERADQGEFPVPAAELAALVKMVQSRSLSAANAKEVFALMVARAQGAAQLVEELGVAAIRDRGPVEAAVAQVIAAHPGPVAQVRGGKTATLGFLIGQVMKATRGQADPQVVREVLQEALDREPE